MIVIAILVLLLDACQHAMTVVKRDFVLSDSFLGLVEETLKLVEP